MTHAEKYENLSRAEPMVGVCWVNLCGRVFVFLDGQPEKMCREIGGASFLESRA